jgi:type IV pilus assembly protein PilX
MALVSALLLLLVTTMLGLAMFRSIGLLEAVAGNTREKQRAMHAAQAAQTYAEWWLTQSQGENATSGKACPAGIDTSLANAAICDTVLANPTTLPWTAGFQYSPPGMSTGNMGAPGNFASAPFFYIAYLGNSYDSVTQAQTTSYQIDALGYAGTKNSAAVAESTYSVTATYTSANAPKKSINLGGP